LRFEAQTTPGSEITVAYRTSVSSLALIILLNLTGIRRRLRIGKQNRVIISQAKVKALISSA